MIFAGGTGVLVFTDIIAYVMRRTLAKLNEAYKMITDEDFSDLAEDFSLILHLSVSKREEAIGIEMYEAFHKVCQENGSNAFTLVANFTREGGKRLNTNEVESLFSTHKPKMAWVCGAPLYNEIFERNFYGCKEPKVEIF